MSLVKIHNKGQELSNLYSKFSYCNLNQRMHPIHHISKLLQFTAYNSFRYTCSAPINFQQFFITQEANI